MSFPNVIFGTPGMQFTVNTAAAGRGANSIGTQMVFADGRKFRWSQAGAVALVAGDLQQAAIPISTMVLLTPGTAGAIGDGSLSVVLGAAAIAANFLQDGTLSIELGTGFGFIYTIRAHAAFGSGATVSIPIVETLQTAIPTTANSVSLTQNAYQNVIQAIVTTPTAAPVGVAVKPIALSGFGFLQTAGVTSVATSGTLVIGQTCMPGGVAGAVSPITAFSVQPAVGIVYRVATTGNKSVVKMLLDT